jgi:lipid-A-disaccharide synthase
MLFSAEPSGDLHAAELVRELKALTPVRVIAAGGRRLADAGAEVRWDSTDWGAMGIPQALRKLPIYLRAARDLLRAVVETKPDMVVLVDAATFNTTGAAMLKRRLPDLPIFYYFPPRSWRSGPRVKNGKLLRVTDYIATPFPWNAAALVAQGASVRWVGHPAVDRIRRPEDRGAEKEKLGLSRDAVVIGLMPGSRARERAMLGQAFLEAAALLRQRFVKTEILWSQPPEHVTSDLALGVGGFRSWARPVASSADLLAASDVALTSFGTVTLEAALADCPMVGSYRITFAETLQAKLLGLGSPLYAMPNIIVGREVIPELVQKDATPENLADAAYRLVADEQARAEVLAVYEKVRQELGPPGAARRAAEMVVDALEGRLAPHTRTMERVR